MHFVRSVQYVSGYTLRLGFEDGSVRLVDLAAHLDGEMFQPLKDVAYFKTVRVHPELDTVVWENGADICPDFLFEIGVPVRLDQGTRQRRRTPAKGAVLAVAEARAGYVTRKARRK
jgi:hypothetical protein